MTLLLENKVAIVTGAGSGIGRASALRFAAEGAAVLVVDVRGHKARATAVEIVDGGGQAQECETDVSDPTQVEAMVATAVCNLGRLDVLFNNAGVSLPGTAVELSGADWERIWNTNVSSLFYGTKFAVPVMSEQGGSIVATASISGLVADGGQVGYAASKAAVIGLTRALAVDHARHGIRVNCICPGITATPPMLHALGDGPLSEAAASAIPVGRLGSPDEIAAVAAWLASTESSFVTGQAIVVDGGLTAESHFSRMMRSS
jgi:meso-butanediol dehydrogenase / (S,S)-butanediol dehydrogenase / diacetyl reductase